MGDFRVDEDCVIEGVDLTGQGPFISSNSGLLRDTFSEWISTWTCVHLSIDQIRLFLCPLPCQGKHMLIHTLRIIDKLPFWLSINYSINPSLFPSDASVSWQRNCILNRHVSMHHPSSPTLMLCFYNAALAISARPWKCILNQNKLISYAN